MTIFEDAIPHASEELSGVSKKNSYPAWTRPKYMDERDHKQLRHIYDLYKQGKFKQAMDYASFNCDTAIREEIPGEIWKKMGGELTPSGEARLKAKLKAKKGKAAPAKQEKKKQTLVFHGGVRILKGVIEKEWELELTDAEYIEVLDIAEAGSDNFIDLVNNIHKDTSEFLKIMRQAFEIWDEKSGKDSERNNSKFNEKYYANRKDDENPQFIFSMTSDKVLVEALNGDFDLVYMLRRELANRGLDQNGKWIGFEKAKEIHRVS